MTPSLAAPLAALRHRPNMAVGSGIVVLFIAVALAAPWLAPYHPVQDANLMYAEEPPGLQFLLGTDAQGRDILSRVLYGAQISLTVGVVTQSINTVLGIALGLTAGYFGGRWDSFVTGLTNVMLSIPSLIFALAIMAAIGPGLVNVLIALGMTNWSYTCRITRSQTLSARSAGYVKSARAIGYGPFNIMVTQILPNILGPILVLATLGVGAAILTEASLSFLGLGVQPPSPSWGSMLSTARDQLFTAPWIAIAPGVAIFLTVLGFNLLGDGLRDMLDPHRRQRT